MKKIIAFLLSFTMLIVPFVMPTGAADDKKTVFDDGSFIIEAIDEDELKVILKNSTILKNT